MVDLLIRLIAIVLMRLGPQDLPPGRVVLITCLGLYTVVTSISLFSGDSERPALAVLMIALLMPMLTCWIVLKLRNRLARWEQTVSALFGTSAVLSMITLPFLLGAPAETPAPLALFLLVAFFWSFAVDAHIWRHALEVAYSTGLALAAVLFALTLFTINSLAGSS